MLSKAVIYCAPIAIGISHFYSENLKVNQFSHILDRATRGDQAAADQLLPVLYQELRELAAAKLARERNAPFDATSLVHEAYIRLAGSGIPQQRWDGRGHFFAAAAEAMRRILVDRARRVRRPKHGGDRKRLDLDRDCVAAPAQADEVLALDEALAQLAAEDSSKAELVKLRYFAGLTLEEAAAAMDISLATAKRKWAFARAWLYSALTDSPLSNG